MQRKRKSDAHVAKWTNTTMFFKPGHRLTTRLEVREGSYKMIGITLACDMRQPLPVSTRFRAVDW